jgi:hypothetical protein
MMPYIKDTMDAREDLLSGLVRPATSGELNFLFTAHINDFLDLRGLSYENINAAVGALECAKMELYRRIAAPYEDTKIAENGDVYDPKLLTESDNDVSEKNDLLSGTNNRIDS